MIGAVVARYLNTGVFPGDTSENNDAALDDAGTPPEPISTDIVTSYLPWYDGLEDPGIPTGLGFEYMPNPQIDVPDLGAQPIVGAYDGAYRTSGPVRQWGEEQQALGRRMRFPTNAVERYDPNGVQMPSYADELASAIANGSVAQPTSSDATANLLLFR